MPFITCGNSEFEIPYINDDAITSQYIKDLIQTYDNIVVIVPIPDIYCTIISNYIDFVNDINDQITITKQSLELYLNLDTLLIDDAYLSYLVQQIFDQWSELSNIVYNDLNDDLQWSFFLYSPYDFIPNHLFNNKLFMQQWNENNQNKVIKVNDGTEVYYNNVKVIDSDGLVSISTYHTVDGEDVGFKTTFKYYPNGNLLSESEYFDGKLNGVSRGWYDNENDSGKIHLGMSNIM
jgi:hypothetical protein